MTLEQATQKILDKALSLTDGWVEVYEEYLPGTVTRHYSNPALPGIVLIHNYSPKEGGGTAHIRTDKGDFIVSSDALLKHVSVIRESIASAAQKATEDAIIAIAQQISP